MIRFLRKWRRFFRQRRKYGRLLKKGLFKGMWAKAKNNYILGGYSVVIRDNQTKEVYVVVDDWGWYTGPAYYARILKKLTKDT